MQDTETLPASDAELISRVRAGDADAYGELFERHRAAATRLARQLGDAADADDLVSEAFAKLLSVLRSGGGPDVAFRAYLLTAVRRLQVDRWRSGRRLHSTDDLEAYEDPEPFVDPAVDDFERGAAARAFSSLPERWQLVLWHCEVEGSKPAEVAPLLGMTPNSVAALAYRAREGLRQAYLRSHLADTAEGECRWTTEHLGGYVRGGLSHRDRARVEHHVDECRRCAALALELAELNSNLRGLLAPWLLGAAASGYLAATKTAVAASASWWSRTVAAASTAGGAPAGAVVAAGVTVAAVVGAAVVAHGPLGTPNGNSPASDRVASVAGTSLGGAPTRDRVPPATHSTQLPSTAHSREPRQHGAPSRHGSANPGAADDERQSSGSAGAGATGNVGAGQVASAPPQRPNARRPSTSPGHGSGTRPGSSSGQSGGGPSGSGGGASHGGAGGTGSGGTAGGAPSGGATGNGGSPGPGRTGGRAGPAHDSGHHADRGHHHTPGTDPQPEHGNDGEHGHHANRGHHTPGTDPQPEHGNDGEHGHHANRGHHTPGTDPQPEHGNDGEHGHHANRGHH